MYYSTKQMIATAAHRRTLKVTTFHAVLHVSGYIVTHHSACAVMHSSSNNMTLPLAALPLNTGSGMAKTIAYIVANTANDDHEWNPRASHSGFGATATAAGGGGHRGGGRMPRTTTTAC